MVLKVIVRLILYYSFTKKQKLMQGQISSQLVLPSTQQHHIQIPQLSQSTKRIDYLRANSKQLFQLFNHIKANPNANVNESINKIFTPEFTSVNVCMKKQSFYYVCVTCSQDPEIKICSDCFNKDYHKNHNYFINQCSANTDCDCGLSGYDGKCTTHKPSHKYLFKKPHQKYYPFIAFIVEILNHIFKLSKQDRFLFKRLTQDIFKLLKQLNDYSTPYNIATHYCFSMPFVGRENTSLLQITIQLNNSEYLFGNQFGDLLRQLCNYEPFCILYVHTAFKFLGYQFNFSSTDKLKQGEKLFKTLVKSPYVLSEAAKWRQYSIGANSITAIFSNLFVNLDKYDKQYRIMQPLVPIAKMYIDNFSTSIRSYINSKWAQSFYNRVSCDGETLGIIIGYQITKKTYFPIWSRPSDSSWFNMIVRVSLNAVKGDFNNLPQFFKHVQPKKLKSFVLQYFKIIFRKKGKCKFNGLTAKCIFRIAQQNNWIEQLNKLPEVAQLDCCKFAKNLLIVLRNLISANHLAAHQMLKVANINKNADLANSQIKIIVQWFRDFLFMQKQVSNSTIQSMKHQGLINFKQAIEVLENETQYNEDRKIFIYIGNDRTINPNLVLWNVKQMVEVDGINYYEENNLFYTEERKIILEALYGNNIKRILTKDYLSYPKRQRYEISLTAVILDKIMQGRNANIRQYVETIKKLNQLSKNTDARIQRLFQVNKNSVMSQVQTESNKIVNPIQNIAQVSNQVDLRQAIQSSTSLQQLHSEPSIKSTTSLKQLKEGQAVETKPQKIMTESQRKRAQKMKRLKEKFHRKSSKYSSMSAIKSETSLHEQTCLICRESSNHDRTFLYYLGSLKTDETINILLGLDDNEQTLSSCFHAYHQKCLAKINSSTCILCKFVGNCVLPVMNDSPQSQYFTHIWWKDFLSLNSFTPKQNVNSYYGNYGYYYNNNQQTKTPQTVEQPENKKPYQNFMMIYKSIVHRIASLTSQSSWENFVRRIQYFCHLIQAYYDGLKKNESVQLKKQIEEYEQKIITSLKLTDYVKQLSRLACQAMLVRLENANKMSYQQHEQFKERCQQIVNKYPPKFTQGFIKKIQWLVNYKVGEREEIPNHQFSSQELLKHVFNLEVPPTMLDLACKRSFCQKCNQQSNFFCLFCRKVGCRRCENPNSHVKQSHGNACIVMLCIKSGKLLQVNTNIIKQSQVYFDAFQLPFDEMSSQDYTQYKISKLKINKVFESILKRF